MTRPAPIALARAGLAAGIAIAAALQLGASTRAEPLPLAMVLPVEPTREQNMTGLDEHGRPNLFGFTSHAPSAEAPRSEARMATEDLSLRLLLQAAGRR